MKKNVTVVLDEATARWARLEAARRDTSVSQLLGEILRAKMNEQRAYARARADWATRGPCVLKDAGTSYPSRDEVHER